MNVFMSICDVGTGSDHVYDDDDEVYLDKLQTRGVKKSILNQYETTANKA
jgi:hypothetical protein